MATSVESTSKSYPAPPSDSKERTRVYRSNYGRISDEQKSEFAGQWIAISWDNTEILDSDVELPRLSAKLELRGIEPEHVVYSRIPGLGEDLIEHGSDFEVVNGPAEV